MISYIIGDIKYTTEDYIIVENNNIGYMIKTSLNSLRDFEINNEYKIYTSMQVREDDISLYGFSTKEELEMFNLLILVSSIGPKNAIKILSTLSINDIKNAILTNDINTLTKAKGVGKKTASMIILDLKDSIKKLGFVIDSEKDSNSYDNYVENGDNEAAFDALINLGYPRNDIKDVFHKLDTKNMSLEEIIRESMKMLGKNYV
ncbi:MAG: Holliday junction branch migration protein RuvA [Tissierellia bacterium]|nr:Holliday junction branch migration protein RuvA [Tissierellia bacterium]